MKKIKREIRLIAHRDEKIYDGTDFSAFAPTFIGDLSEGHAAVVMQKFETKNVGEIALVPDVRVFDKRGKLVDYSIVVQTTMGRIRPRCVKVWAASDTKEYDGTAISSVVPNAENLAFRESAIATQVFDTPESGINKTLIPALVVNDGNGGKNYEIVLKVVHNGTILPLLGGLKPDTRKSIAEQLGTDDFTVIQEGELSSFIGEVCYLDDKKIYLKLQAKKRIQLIIEIERLHQQLEEIEIGEKLQVTTKGKETKINLLNSKKLSLGSSRHSR